MLPTQIYGTVAFWGNHSQTQVHDQHYPTTLWIANLTSHETACLWRTVTAGIQASHS
ncbi:hypothetical protein K443DRAFT_112132 [Laccaria amethystina LaAM-08-1]|uniref:Uncharacterized protein n=1 Tax=Laccaria amethystina LaAM-08-1 TaxID=1095629 RepID=A0A0C9XAU0_9AGAR|nr:hypothetical protein K443DRAFT_112132 [Laccaria amethystina LaAM-08-1]